MRMTFRTTACVVLLTVSCGATADEPTKGEAVATTPEGSTNPKIVVPLMGAAELRKRIEANPNEVVDLSQWTSITPELAEVVICCDEEVRPVRRTRKVRYTVRVPAEGGSAVDPKEESREKRVAYVVEVPGRALRLNGVESLTRETAATLGGHIGDLELNGLRELGEQVTSELSFHQGVLFLDGVETLSRDCASHLCNHDGPVSLRGIKRLSVDAYGELANGSSLREEFVAWLPSTVVIEQEAGPEPFVRWSAMASSGDVESYVRQMTAQTDVEILVDTDALKRLALSVNDKMSAPAGTIQTSEEVGTGVVTKSSARIVADVMGLEEAVVWIAKELNHRLRKDSKENVVVLANGDSFLLTVRPKADTQPGPPEWEEIELSKGEKSLWYQCKGESVVDDAHLSESGWQPPWHRRMGGGFGGGAF